MKKVKQHLDWIIILIVIIFNIFILPRFEIEIYYRQTLAVFSCCAMIVFITRKQTGIEKRYEKNNYNDKFWHTEVRSTGMSNFDNVFSTYLNEFIEKHDFNAFKRELLKNIDENNYDLESIIKYFEFLEVFTEKNIAINNRKFDFAFIYIALVLAFVGIFSGIQFDNNYYFTFLILGIFIFIKMYTHFYLNPYSIQPIYYKHCIEILKEKKNYDEKETDPIQDNHDQ